MILHRVPQYPPRETSSTFSKTAYLTLFFSHFLGSGTETGEVSTRVCRGALPAGLFRWRHPEPADCSPSLPLMRFEVHKTTRPSTGPPGPRSLWRSVVRVHLRGRALARAPLRTGRWWLVVGGSSVSTGLSPDEPSPSSGRGLRPVPTLESSKGPVGRVGSTDDSSSYASSSGPDLTGPVHWWYSRTLRPARPTEDRRVDSEGSGNGGADSYGPRGRTGTPPPPRLTYPGSPTETRSAHDPVTDRPLGKPLLG